jgi:CheY-like chemotaxis protein
MIDSPASSAAAPLRLQRVLVVDDDEFVRNAIVRQLRGLGVADVSASAGDASTVQLLDEGAPFELVITDLAMPALDGLQLTREIAARQPGVAVLYVSAAGSKLLGAAKTRAIAQGLRVVGCLEKPVSREALRRMLEAMYAT